MEENGQGSECGIDRRQKWVLFSHTSSKPDSLEASKTEMFYQVCCANLRSRKITTFYELFYELDYKRSKDLLLILPSF